MAGIVFFVYLLLLLFMYAIFGMGGGGFSSFADSIRFGLAMFVLLFGSFSNIMWFIKSRKRENYKIWFYLSVTFILLFLFVLMV